jgi:hypothetical protein
MVQEVLVKLTKVVVVVELEDLQLLVVVLAVKELLY